jgi:hypothetical protein
VVRRSAGNVARTVIELVETEGEMELLPMMCELRWLRMTPELQEGQGSSFLEMRAAKVVQRSQEKTFLAAETAGHTSGHALTTQLQLAGLQLHPRAAVSSLDAV